MIEAKGKCGISAKAVCDSVAPDGTRLLTMELTYPRIIHSEFLTHRMLSRNSASSRAIPFEKMKEQLTGMPVRFGAANKGMQDGGEYNEQVFFCNDIYGGSPKDAWLCAKDEALGYAKSYYDAGYAKQVFNRLTEPFQMMKTLVTATEWNNFFWLRLDEGAVDPTMFELARCMKEVFDKSVPTPLKAGEWHLPYVDQVEDEYGKLCGYCVGEYPFQMLQLEEAKIVSAARCAAISFRNTDYNLNKSKEVFYKLVGDRVHGSALEHQATPTENKDDRYCGFRGIDRGSVNLPFSPKTWQQGITHCDRDGNLWSGNFKGWIQHRKLIDGENHA